MTIAMPGHHQAIETPIPLPDETLRHELAAHNILHIWHLPLHADATASYRAEDLQLLSAAERSQLDNFRVEEPRRTYFETRIGLRRLLGMYLQQPPAAVTIETTSFGKPYLARPADGWLCFNAAHSGGRAVLAIGRDRRIGVDVERVRQDLDHAALAKDFFAPEEQTELAQLPDAIRLRAFFDCWTRKEAYLKATGLGLSTPLDSFHVRVGPGTSSALLSIEGDTEAAKNWALLSLATGPDYAGAVATDGALSYLRCLDYAPRRADETAQER